MVAGDDGDGRATITLMLDGDPTVDEFVTALQGFRTILKRAAKPAHVGEVTWELDNLIKASAGLTARCHTQTQAQATVACSRVLQVAREARDGIAADGINKMLSVLGPNVPSIRLETIQGDVTLTAQIANAETAGDAIGEVLPAWGAVRGRVQTLSNRGTLHFILYDLLHDKAVSCYLEEGMHEHMRDLWGELASVEGVVKRDPISGRPQTIRQVTTVERVDSVAPSQWREAANALAGISDEPAEEIVRRLRSV